MSVAIEPPAGIENFTSELDYQVHVVGALRLMGWVVIEIRVMFGNSKGIPDLLCFRGGQGAMIELKLVGNYLSAAQRRWQERWLPEGTVVHLVRNTNEDWTWLMGKMA
jgi:hypothetical protein